MIKSEGKKVIVKYNDVEVLLQDYLAISKYMIYTLVKKEGVTIKRAKEVVNELVKMSQFDTPEEAEKYAEVFKREKLNKK